MPLRRFVFVSGMPRAGSTLLCNLLAQNPRFAPSATSGALEVMFQVRNQWDTLIEHKAMDAAESTERKRRVLRAILEGYYWQEEQSLVLSKCRGWLAHIEMLEHVLGEPVQLLVPVRDIRDILASFERLWREAAKDRQLSQEAADHLEFQTLPGRLRCWTQSKNPVGLAYDRIKDALARGYRDRLHFVHFEALTTRPLETMERLYRFLGEPYYLHNPAYVVPKTRENDEVYGMPELHRIRHTIAPVEAQWPRLLGEAALLYTAANDLWAEL